MRNIQEKWVFPELLPVPGLFQVGIGGSSLVASTLFRRGLTALPDALGFIDPDRYTPSAPAELPGLLEAADIAQDAIDGSRRILVWGDFDVDGQTSTTLLYSGLSQLGADVSFYIPIRATESHGVSLPSLQDKLNSVQPDLLITCDTGIDALDSINFARAAGVDVVITDHHQLPPTLPDANSIINPNLLPPGHPLFSLPGVGVAYKLIEELFSRNDLDPSPLLDLVALGIVADVAVQTGDTRYLLQRGLSVLRQYPRPGLLALYGIAGITPENISEEQIGFVIGPRLNALGRLSNANSSVEFFTTVDPARAQELAALLDSLNARRQDLTESIFNDALSMIEKSPYLVEEFPVIVLSGPASWEPGVIGIVASRLVERFNKPVIILSKDGELSRGSARSIPSVHIADLIGASGDLLISYGGHPMAAGLSLLHAQVSNFRRSLSDNFYRLAGKQPEEISVNIDAEITFEKATKDLVKDLQRLAPFGAGNPKLLFATRGVVLQSDRIIGKNENHRKLTFSDSRGMTLDLLWWNSSDIPLPDAPFDIAYTLDLTTYKGQLQVQSTLRHIRQSTDAPVYIKQASPLNFIDLRNSKDPSRDLSDLLETHNGIIWAEFLYPPGIPSSKRSELYKHKTLIVWTIPPSRFVFSQIVSHVSPNQIVLFGVNPSFPSQKAFLESLLGLIKHLQKSRKSFSLEGFAQALAVPADLIEVGLEWLHLQGDYDLSALRSTGELIPGQGSIQPGFREIDSRLKMMLQEISAYRDYFLSAPLNALL